MSQFPSPAGAGTHAASGTPPLPSAPDEASQALPLQFRGRARDYFGVWAVNVLLTLCTLGIWSAWAKVRTMRWFRGHTYLAGAGFDYHATGGQIFKGRLLAIAIIAAVSLIGAVWPLAERLLSLFILLAVPWLVNASLGFRAYMTSWSNVRFGFQGSYGRALLVFVFLPLLSIFTLGLLTPLATQQRASYVAGGHRYGYAAFFSAPRLAILYAGLLRGMGIFIVVCLVGMLAAQWVGQAANPEFSFTEMLRGLTDPSHRHPSAGPHMFLSVFPVLLATLYAALIVAALYYGACAHNEILNRCTLQGRHRLHSAVAPWRYTWITLSGIAASILTLGLAYPWARVRQYRYVTQRITVLAAPGLDEFVSRQLAHVPGAFGAEFSQLEGFAGVSAL